MGLTRGVNKNHIIRATLDSLCYQINDVLTAMEADSGIAMTALKVDGGACANNYLMQTMADISSLPVKRPCCVETTALGAAYLAGLAVGYWKSTEEVLQNWAVDRKFTPPSPRKSAPRGSRAGTRRCAAPTAGRRRIDSLKPSPKGEAIPTARTNNTRYNICMI